MRKHGNMSHNRSNQVETEQPSLNRKQEYIAPKQASSVHVKENFCTTDERTGGKQRHRQNGQSHSNNHQQQYRNKSLVSKSWQYTPSQPMPSRNMHQHAGNRKSYEGSSGSRKMYYQDPSSFFFYIGTADETICAQRAEGTMTMLRNLMVEPIPELLDAYVASDEVLRCCAQGYLDGLEASKARATEAWLQSRPEAEQEMYRQRVSKHNAIRQQVQSHSADPQNNIS